jgi:D-xylose 1-dehydrogenase (NADP+, D-xylono-1,5-lactone-forming)
MYRFHPQHKRVREIIDSGVIGEVPEVHSHLSNDMMSPPDPKNVRLILNSAAAPCSTWAAMSIHRA